MTYDHIAARGAIYPKYKSIAITHKAITTILFTFTLFFSLPPFLHLLVVAVLFLCFRKFLLLDVQDLCRQAMVPVFQFGKSWAFDFWFKLLPVKSGVEYKRRILLSCPHVIKLRHNTDSKNNIRHLDFLRASSSGSCTVSKERQMSL